MLGVALGISMETAHLNMIQSKGDPDDNRNDPTQHAVFGCGKFSLCTEANFAIHSIGKVLAGVADQWSKVSLSLIFSSFYCMKGLPNQHENI